MAPSHEFFIVQSQYGIIAVQKVRMEDDLHAIVRVVEQLDATNLIQNRVVGVVLHVVGHNRRQRIPFQGENPAFQQDLVFFR